MNLGELSGFFFDGFCRALGCGEGAGLILVGAVVAIIFFSLLAIYRLGLDVGLVVGSFLLIGLSGSGLLPSWVGLLPWVAVGLIWLFFIFRLKRL